MVWIHSLSSSDVPAGLFKTVFDTFAFVAFTFAFTFDFGVAGWVCIVAFTFAFAFAFCFGLWHFNVYLCLCICFCRSTFTYACTNVTKQFIIHTTQRNMYNTMTHTTITCLWVLLCHPEHYYT